MKRRFFERIGLWLGIGLWLLPGRLQGADRTVRYVPADSVIYARCLTHRTGEETAPAGEKVLRAARLFLHTPYVGGTLEGEPEQLTVNLRAMDCMTFVEQTLALAGALQEGWDFSRYCASLRELRYRTPERLSYTGRLHYLTDWAYENERRGYVKDVTQPCGGAPWHLLLGFMSHNASRYPALREAPERIAEMRRIEETVSARPHFYIPKEAIGRHADTFRQGDIVGFVTTVPGLDVSHVGILCREEGRLTFIHASSRSKRVVVQPGTLEQYVAGQKNIKGILLLRPQRF